jgi:hypothetical protein
VIVVWLLFEFKRSAIFHEFLELSGLILAEF